MRFRQALDVAANLLDCSGVPNSLLTQQLTLWKVGVCIFKP